METRALRTTIAATLALCAAAPSGWAARHERSLPTPIIVKVAAAAPLPIVAAAEIRPLTDLRAAAAPAPQAAAAGLQSLVSATAEQQKQPVSLEANMAAGSFFDVRSPKVLAAATLVTSAAAASGGAALPAAYALARYSADRAQPSRQTPPSLKEKVLENVEAHILVLPMLFAASAASWLLGDSALLPVALAAVGAVTAVAMEQTVSKLRRTIVGGWQASHDQRYRVDTRTGELHDVRGHKYGSDRYEAYAEGVVTPGERLWYRLVGAGLAFSWIGLSPDFKTFVLGAALTAAYIAHDFVRLRRRPAAVPSEEDRAHAARFKNT